MGSRFYPRSVALKQDVLRGCKRRGCEKETDGGTIGRRKTGGDFGIFHGVLCYRNDREEFEVSCYLQADFDGNFIKFVKVGKSAAR